MARANRPRRHRTRSPGFPGASCGRQRSPSHTLAQSRQHKRRSSRRAQSRPTRGLGSRCWLVALARASSPCRKQSPRQNGLALAHLPGSDRSSSLELPRNVTARREHPVGAQHAVPILLFLSFSASPLLSVLTSFLLYVITSSRSTRLFHRQLPLPSRNHHTSHAIPQHCNDGPSHVHQLIDGKKQEQRLHRQMKRSCRSKYNQHRSPRHTRRSLTTDYQSQQHHHLLPHRKMHPRRLRHKNQRERLINRRAIHIEAIPRRQNERHGLPWHAKRLHLLHRPRQSCLRTRRAKRNRQRLGDRLNKSPHRHACHHHNRQQHAYHKKNQRRVHRPQQLQQRQQHSQAQMPDRVSHRPKHANRRRIHHQIRELEHRLRKAPCKRQHRPPLRLRHQNQRHAKQHAEHHHLQHRALRRGLRNTLRKNIRNHLRRRVRRHVQRFARRRSRQTYAITRPAQTNRRPPDEQ